MNKNTKNTLSTIPPSRLFIYLTFAIVFLFTILAVSFFKKNNEWTHLDERINQLTRVAQKEVFKKREFEKIKSHYIGRESQYIQNHLGTMALLEQERSDLKKVIDSPGFCGNKQLEARLAYLTSAASTLRFQEHPLYTSNRCKEVEVKLSHAVEVSLHDLENLLTKIEKEDPKRPLLYTTKFHLKRKKPLDQNEVFEVNFTLLKREFLDL